MTAAAYTADEMMTVAAARHLALPVTSDYRTNFHAYGRHYQAGWLARPIMGYLRKFHNRTQCTMVPTEAMRAEHVPELWEQVEAHRTFLESEGLLEEQRRKNLAGEVFAVASARASGPIEVRDVANVATSFPGFVQTARNAGLQIEAL